MQQNKLVTFILGVYNTKNFDDFDRSIENMLNQTYKNVEVIVCDDCSTNGIYEHMLDEYGNHPQITILRNEQNSGAAYSRNRCIEVAKGEYIAVQDDDDYSSIDRIEKEAAFLENNPEYGFVSAGLEKFDKDGTWGRVVVKEKPNKRDFRNHSQHVHAATLFRAECIRAVNGYRTGKKMAGVEDYDLFIRLYANGFIGYNLQDIVYYYNIPRTGRKHVRYRFSINEARIRAQGFKALKLPLTDRIYVLRPLIAGLFSEKFKNSVKKMRRRNKK